MFERFKFARYALRFERAFKTDDWTAVRKCFDDDATYTVIGTATRYDGETRGADRIMRMFKDMLDELDRKFDRRSAGITGAPRVIDGELVLPWRARYTLGADQVILHGTSRCRFAGRKIRALSDTMDPEESRRWLALAGIAP